MDWKVRKSIRLKHYDYSQPGLYFITVCCFQRRCLFGQINGNHVELSGFGNLATECWLQSSRIRTDIELHDFVVMPNHMHAIVEIVDCRGSLREPAFVSANLRSTIGNLVAGFKASVTKKCREISEDQSIRIWQRNYHDHVIRNEEQLLKLIEYIENNPLKWALDRYYQC